MVGAAGATTYVDARDMARDEAAAEVESTVTLQADSLSRWIAGVRTQTRTLSARESLAAGDRTEKRRRLAAAMNRSSNGVRAMYLVDADRGVVTASTMRTVEGWSLTEWRCRGRTRLSPPRSGATTTCGLRGRTSRRPRRTPTRTRRGTPTTTSTWPSPAPSPVPTTRI
ncbi:hypothetical protein ACFQJ6_11840 [Halorussus caseinilyticus]|uniref:Uncharacterized protein n=1 Tax=Halorussus caseinilyticus TaxID=3034025 RepID=A0ABD5WJG8_9EURY